MLYIFLADGFEEVEALTVVDMLRRADINISTVSVNNNFEVCGAHNIKLICDLMIEDIELCDGVILPGGIPGVPNLASDNRVVESIKSHYNNNKLIAAICAAPTLLHSIGLLDGIKATCYPTMLDDLKNAKAIKEKVVIENNIITSMAPGTAFDFAYEIIKYFKGKEVADVVKNNAYFK